MRKFTSVPPESNQFFLCVNTVIEEAAILFFFNTMLSFTISIPQNIFLYDIQRPACIIIIFYHYIDLVRKPKSQQFIFINFEYFSHLDHLLTPWNTFTSFVFAI